jgi:hypothetical protein
MLIWVLLHLLAPFALAHRSQTQTDLKVKRSDSDYVPICGTPSMNYTRMYAVENEFSTYMQANGQKIASSQQIPSINVYVHIITTETGLGDVSDANVANQIKILNVVFLNQLTFTLVSIGRTINSKWFNTVGQENEEEDKATTEMKNALRKGSSSDLNLYTVGFPGSGLLGFATFPSDYAEFPKLDGVVVQYSTFPNGPNQQYNLGIVTCHEVGVYLFACIFISPSIITKQYIL